MNNKVAEANYFVKYRILCEPWAHNANIAIFFDMNPKYAAAIRKKVLIFAQEKYDWVFTSHKVPMEYFIEKFNLDPERYKKLAIEKGQMDLDGNPLVEVEYVF